MGLTSSVDTTFHEVSNAKDLNEHRVYMLHLFPLMSKADPTPSLPQYSVINGWINRREYRDAQSNEYVCDDQQWVGYVFSPKDVNITNAFTNKKFLEASPDYSKRHYIQNHFYRDARIEYLPPLTTTFDNKEYIMAQMQPPYEVEHYMDASFHTDNYKAINHDLSKGQHMVTVCHVFSGGQCTPKQEELALPHEPNRIWADFAMANIVLPTPSFLTVQGAVKPTTTTTTAAPAGGQVVGAQDTPVSGAEQAESSSSDDDDDDDEDDGDSTKPNKQKKKKGKKVNGANAQGGVAPQDHNGPNTDYSTIQINSSNALNTVLKRHNRVHFAATIYVDMRDGEHVNKFQEMLKYLYSLDIFRGLQLFVYAFGYSGEDESLHMSRTRFENLAAALGNKEGNQLNFAYSSSLTIVNQEVEKALDEWMLKSLMPRYASMSK